jgi:hypothetical protein
MLVIEIADQVTVTSYWAPFGVTVQEAEATGAERITTSPAATGAASGAVGPISEHAANVTAAPATITTRNNRIMFTSHPSVTPAPEAIASGAIFARWITLKGRSRIGPTDRVLVERLVLLRVVRTQTHRKSLEDRLSVTHQHTRSLMPIRGVFLTGEWRYLAMVNYRW